MEESLLSGRSEEHQKRLSKFLSSVESRLAVKPNIVAVMADMDRMLEMNDDFGQPIGNVVLLAVRQIFAKEFGNNFCQLGDDFWAFADESMSPSIEKTLDSLRLEVENLRFDEHPQVKARISIGIAFSDGSENAEDLFRMADNGLYQAKRQGGNCIKVYAP
jgi:diguanylate cyclase (GGDEF)-like protein